MQKKSHPRHRGHRHRRRKGGTWSDRFLKLGVNDQRTNEESGDRIYHSNRRSFAQHIQSVNQSRSRAPNKNTLPLDSRSNIRKVQRRAPREQNVNSDKQPAAPNIPYAQLAQSAYVNSKDPVGDWIQDTELSSLKNRVFRDPNTGKVVISYRGTDPMILKPGVAGIPTVDPASVEDLIDDAAILNFFMPESRMSRFQEADKLYQQVVQKYGKENVTLTGHSLGGTIALYVAEKNDVVSYTYNPGISAISAFQKHEDNVSKQYIFRTKYDPVSVGALIASWDNNRVVNTIPQSSVFNPHGTGNFTDADGKRGTTLETVLDTVAGEISQLANVAMSELVDEVDPLGLMNIGKPMSDEDAHAIGLDRVADALKSSTRRDEDRLMELADSQHKTYFEIDPNTGGPKGYQVAWP